MIVLGLNGWPGRSHDASACVVIDGEVVAFCEEERLSRKKHAYDVAPVLATQWCLSKANTTLADVDVVAVGWDLPRLHESHGMSWELSSQETLERLLPRSVFPRERDPQLEFVPHHIAHAASACHQSAFGDSAVVIVDGQGEEESSSAGRAGGGKLSLTSIAPPAWSLGYFYEAVCQFVGLRTNDPGKLMGLAGHGQATGSFDSEFTLTATGYATAVDPAIRSTGVPDDQERVLEAWLRRFEEILPLEPNYRDENGRTRFDPFDYRDVAASAQEMLENTMVHVVERTVAATGCPDVVMAGGVCLNATANAKILARPSVDRLFVQPVAHDAGVSLGAALHVAAESGARVRPLAGSVAWGPDFDDGEVARRLAALGVAATRVADPAVRAADLISSGKIVAWHQGRSEAGPRALGHRSILADPRLAATRDHINAHVKERELWRPLAPSIAKEHAASVLGSETDLPYMIVAGEVREDVRDDLQAVVHTDGSTRPQTVDRQVDPLYHSLLMEVGERTGRPVVLNTSFNGREEPIVSSPEDAVRTFQKTPVDALVIGSFIVRKP